MKPITDLIKISLLCDQICSYHDLSPISYDSIGKIMIYTDAAFMNKDGKITHGFHIIDNYIPLVAGAHCGSRASSSKEEEQGLSSLR